MQHIFVCYAYQTNMMLVRPMSSRTDKSMLVAYKGIYEYLDIRGHKPQLNVTDNKCSKVVRNYM